MLNEDYREMLQCLADEGVRFLIPSVDDLIRNKRASGRTKDLADAEALEALKRRDLGKSRGRGTPRR
jgi:hypothetical protein